MDVVRKLWVTLIAVCLASPSTLRAHSPLVMNGVLRGGIAIPEGALTVGITEINRGYSLPRAGYVLGGEMHLGIDDIPLALNVLGSFAFFSNEDINIMSPRDGRMVLSTSMRIVSMGIGVQYNPLEVGPLKPYVGTNGEVSFFSGTLRDELITQAPPFDMNIAIRFGLSLTIGTEIGISGLPFLFDLQAKHLMANLVGKQYKDWSSGYELADGSPPYPGSTKSINYTTVTLGLVFGIF